ncbi:MAG: ATP-binding protein [Nanoarchaeota archaeon]
MITKQELREAIESQNKAKSKKRIIPRETKVDPNTNHITIITGIRRSGKSTLLNQTLQYKRNATSVNFEDPRLEQFTHKDFFKIEELYPDTTTFFFDEIQNIEGWERYVRYAHDNEKQVFITGSNASMLSKELGTKLTGRYIEKELFPFTYNEYLTYTNQKPDLKSFKQYLEKGGFPEYLDTGNDEYLHMLVKNIIARDIIVRKQLRSESVIEELTQYLLSNVGKQHSYNKISKLLNVKSVRSTIDYIKYLQESYLIDILPQYSTSIKKQIMNPKKIYGIDTGIIQANTTSFSKDKGRILENAVFLWLRRTHKELYYFKGQGECDFLIKEKNAITTAIQVCYEVTEQNMKRELEGLQEAMKQTKAKKGFIVTMDQEDELDNIKLIPAWKALSQKSKQ